jgi:hypothetical protein
MKKRLDTKNAMTEQKHNKYFTKHADVVNKKKEWLLFYQEQQKDAENGINRMMKRHGIEKKHLFCIYDFGKKRVEYDGSMNIEKYFENERNKTFNWLLDDEIHCLNKIKLIQNDLAYLEDEYRDYLRKHNINIA